MSQSGYLSASGAGGTDLLTLTGDSGGVINPDLAGNINIIGGGDNVTVVGTAGNNTLTINVNGVEDTVQTVDATPTLLETITLSASEAVLIEVTTCAAQDDYATAIGGIVLQVARRAAAGGAALVSVPSGTLSHDTAGNPEITFVANGNDIEIYVTGVAATTYNWRAFIKVTYDN
jgi:hypothetical protein